METQKLDDATLTAWLRLTAAAGVSRRQARGLLAACGVPTAIFAAPQAALSTVVGVAASSALLRPQPDLRARVAATQAWLAQPQCHLLTLTDPAYPPSLLETPDPPPLLYVHGHLAYLQRPALAVVGSRHASAQGLAHARGFAQACAQAGLTIISGMALGIDGAAHAGALAVGGATVAVLGTGIDRVYPAQHRALARQLAEHGALLSEWPLGTPPRASHFPQRNRLIAGLARGVLVVEAAAQSGSLITAHLANEMGRDVYAIPGSIHSALSKGCHRLIKEGAKLVESVEDILEELAWPVVAGVAHPVAASAPVDDYTSEDGSAPTAAPGPPAAVPLDLDARCVLQALGHDAAAPDVLALRAGLEPGRLQAALLRLELAGHLVFLPCGRVAPHFTATGEARVDRHSGAARNPIEP